jgi:dephospho-CoA kinase
LGRNEKDMIVGLTGGIASGKSESAKYFEELGAFCIDADAISKELTNKGEPSLKELTDIFSANILLPDGSLNRKKLADIIFSDTNAKLKVEHILHSQVISKIKVIISNKIFEKKIIVINAPLLFETGLNKICDKVVVVKVPFDIQVQRLRLRDGLNDDEINNRISSQMSTQEKVKHADFILDNSGSKKDLIEKIKNIYKILTSNLKSYI